MTCSYCSRREGPVRATLHSLQHGSVHLNWSLAELPRRTRRSARLASYFSSRLRGSTVREARADRFGIDRAAHPLRRV